MDFELKLFDNYAHLKLLEVALTKEVASELTSTIHEKVLNKGKKNIILTIEQVTSAEKDFYPAMDNILADILKKEGIIVISQCPEGEIKTKLENKGLILTRSFDEAVDYVFITDIEKDFDVFSDNDDF
jgi:DNA polymerase III alpha subunit (gram-positive type)